VSGAAGHTDGATAGVVGDPVAHSLSPVVHGTWLERFGLTGRYLRHRIPEGQFDREAAALLYDDGWAGMNVTVPHKEAARRFVEARGGTLDPVAARLGAVNTIALDEHGRPEGRNTDQYGFAANLEADPAWQSVGRGAAVVLGAGGAARAVIGALAAWGFAEIRLANRSLERAHIAAETLGPALGASIEPLTLDRASDALEGADLLVNTTSLGMTGQPPLAIALDRLPGSALVTDIVYKPLETDLLARARTRGNPAVDGLGMLLHQAVPGFQAWFKPPQPPQVDADLRARVLAAMDG
jgi:shikimate dehydrogenase